MTENLQKYLSLQDKLLRRIQFKTTILMQIIKQNTVLYTQYCQWQKRISIPLSQPLDDISKYVIEHNTKQIISSFIQEQLNTKSYVVDVDVVPVGINNLYAQARFIIVLNPQKKPQ